MNTFSLFLAVLCCVRASALETVRPVEGRAQTAPSLIHATAIPTLTANLMLPAAMQTAASLEQIVLPAGVSAEQAASAQIAVMSSQVGETLGQVGELSGAEAGSASEAGRAVQDAIEGHRASVSESVVAGPATPQMPALKPAARGRLSSRVASVGAGVLMAAAATPAFAASETVSGVMAPGAIIGVVLASIVSIIIGFRRRQGIGDWVQVAGSYVASFAVTGAAIGAAAYMLGMTAALFTGLGVGVGAGVSLVVAISRWNRSNIDDAYEALQKALVTTWLFGAAGAVLGFAALMGGAVVGLPMGLGLATGGALALLIGANAPQPEYDWLGKTLWYLVVFGIAGLAVGIFTFMFGPPSTILAGAGAVLGLAFALIGGFTQWLNNKRATAEHWLERVAFHMAGFGVFGLVLAGVYAFGGARLVVPATLGAVIGSIAAMFLRWKGLTSDVNDEQQAWLQQALLLGAFMAVVGLVLGGLASLAGIAGPVNVTIPTLPTLPSIPVLNFGPLNFLFNSLLGWAMAVGAGIGALLSFLLGREELKKNRAAWLRKALRLSLTTSVLGTIAGVGLLLVRSFLI